MKKTLVFTVITIMFCACSSKQTSEERPVEYRSIHDYAYLGIMHNDIMSYANNHFQGDEAITTKDEAIKYTNNWVATHMKDITDFTNPSWAQEFELHATNLDTRALVNRLRRGTTRAINEINNEQLPFSEVSLDEALVVAKEFQIIADFEYVKFRKSVGTSAMVGAATSSLGLVGKVGKWISRLF